MWNHYIALIFGSREVDVVYKKNQIILWYYIRMWSSEG